MVYEFNKTLSLTGTLRRDPGQKYYTTALLRRTENFEQLDLFVQNVPCCVFESNIVSKKLLRASPVLNARDSWRLTGFSALMSLPGLKKQFNSAWALFMNVRFPTAFEEQPIAPESLNNPQGRHCTRGGGSGAY